MSYKEFLGDSFDYEKGELNLEKVKQVVLNNKERFNILLVGATGVGKSSLVNAVFGRNVVKAGTGKPVTQHLEKIELPEKGLTLWDTKGIESKDYSGTLSQLKSEIEGAFKNDKPENYPHIAWLCIKESLGRIEEREEELLGILHSLNIPTVVVFTDTRFEAGDEFYQKAQELIDEKYADFIRSRYVRVNSVEHPMMGMTIPVYGLENLLDKTEDCFSDASENSKKRLVAFYKAQEVDNKKRLKAMIEGAKNKVHLAAAAAGTAGASPIPGSDAPIIAGIQSAMIYTINTEFELSVEERYSTAVITQILGVTAVAAVGKTVVSNLLKFIPGAGTLVGGIVSAGTAIALTEAIGFAYISALEHYFNAKTGKVELPVDSNMVLNMFKQFFKS